MPVTPRRLCAPSEGKADPLKSTIESSCMSHEVAYRSRCTGELSRNWKHVNGQEKWGDCSENLLVLRESFALQFFTNVGASLSVAPAHRVKYASPSFPREVV